MAVDEPYDCGQCVRAHGKRFEFPPLDPINLEGWAFYTLLADQVRMGMDVGGLDMTAIPVAFDLYEVPADDRRSLFEKVLVIDRAAQEDRRRRQEREKQQRDARALDAKELRHLHAG